MTSPNPSNWKYLRQGDVQTALETIAVAGEYIESIGKSDLYQFSKEEFETLLLVICNDFVKNTIPF